MTEPDGPRESPESLRQSMNSPTGFTPRRNARQARKGKLLSIVASCFALLLVFVTHLAIPEAQNGSGYSAPRLDAWRILGPGGGGAQFYPAVSPHDPNLVLVACDMTGAYISENGG